VSVTDSLFRVISRLVSKRIGPHVPDEMIVCLILGEATFGQVISVKDHLTLCAKCAGRYRSLDHAVLSLAEYKKSLFAPKPSQLGRWREQFLGRLDEAVLERPSACHVATLNFSGTQYVQRSMLPPAMTLAAALIAAVVLVFSRAQVPSLPSAQLLNRATKMEVDLAKRAGPGVSRQRIRVRSAKGSVERAVYADTKGIRHAKRQKISGVEEQLWNQLARAGVSWEEPLSATVFRAWHDSQRSAEDKVGPPANGVFTLTTTLRDGIVTQESVAFRQTDLHMVRRTIEFRDAGAVEIAELTYEISAWDAGSDSLFEPLPLPSRLASAVGRLPHPALHLLTKSELDEAELEARLALNQLRADAGEQIDLTRKASGIQIEGVVATEQRKRELELGLGRLSNVQASIRSLDDLERSTRTEYPHTVKLESVVAQPSPLQRYFTAHTRSSDDLSRISQQLFDRTLVIAQESRAIADLGERFVFAEPPSGKAASTLNELLSRHQAKLLIALDEEAALVAELGIPVDPAVNPPPSSRSGLDPLESKLKQTAEKNLALCKELISSNQEEPLGPAEVIVSRLSTNMRELRVLASSLLSDPKTLAKPGERN